MCNYSEAILNQWLEKGREEGINVGEERNKEDTARRMIRMNKFSDRDIAEATGLSLQKIQKLREVL